LFFVSTHIVETEQELEKFESVDFPHFEINLCGGQSIYKYKLNAGISSERIGLTILKNENIMAIIGEIINHAFGSKSNGGLTDKAWPVMVVFIELA
jgi:DNA mismatch repair ATPase MutS